MSYHFGSQYFENCCVNFMDRIDQAIDAHLKKRKNNKKHLCFDPRLLDFGAQSSEVISMGGGGSTWWGPEASGQSDPLLGYSLSCSGTCSDFRYYCKSNSWVKFICGTLDLEWNRAFGHAMPSPSSIVKGLWRAKYRKKSSTKIIYFCNYWLLGR